MKSSNCWLAHCIYASEEENTYGGDDKQEMEILDFTYGKYSAKFSAGNKAYILSKTSLVIA